MWFPNYKKLIHMNTQFVKQFSQFVNDIEETALEIRKISSEQSKTQSVKSLKVAILGLPNAGKSTLINFLIGRPVCASSSKIHTTRKKASAIFSTNDTQLIFLDTPGLVSKNDFKKFKLENSFINDIQNSVKEADIIGVVQDVSKIQNRETLNNQIIILLNLFKDIKSILILNKIDTLKNKNLLLEVISKLIKNKNWPHFSDAFMISALTGDGVEDLRNYFLDSAKQKIWDYDQKTFTDQSFETIIQQTLKANLLNNLPQEIPYLINTIVEHIEYNEDGSINIIAIVNCPSVRISSMLIGKGGERIKEIAKQSEQTICKIFRTSVTLKVIIPTKEELKLKKKIV